MNKNLCRSGQSGCGAGQTIIANEQIMRHLIRFENPERITGSFKNVLDVDEGMALVKQVKLPSSRLAFQSHHRLFAESCLRIRELPPSSPYFGSRYH